MTDKIPYCYRCKLNTQRMDADGNEALVQAICIFGEAVNNCDNLSEEIKNEIVGVLNAIIGGYPSTISIPSIFSSFSGIIRKHVCNIYKIEDLWSKIEIIVKLRNT